MNYYAAIIEALQNEDFYTAKRLLEKNANQQKTVEYLNAESLYNIYAGDYEGAIKLLNKRIGYYPDNIDLRLNLGFALENVGKINTAVKEYLKAARSADAEIKKTVLEKIEALYPHLNDKFFPYYVASHDYRNSSAGIRNLHYLCHHLNEMGCEAYIDAQVTKEDLNTPKLTETVKNQHEKEGKLPIAIYYEGVSYNMFDSPVVARWLLNKKDALSPIPVCYGKDEIFFCYDPRFVGNEPNPHVLRMMTYDRNAYFPPQEGSERDMVCFYAHKYLAAGYKVSEKLKNNAFDLGLHHPRSPAELGEIYRKSKVLYVYEPSGVLLEAVMCGCPTYYIKTPYLNNFFYNDDPVLTEDAAERHEMPAFDFKRLLQNGVVATETQMLSQINTLVNITQSAMRDMLRGLREYNGD